MAQEGLEQIGQTLQTTKTVILAVGPEAKKTVMQAFELAYEEVPEISFSARDLGVDATLGGPKRVKVLRDRVLRIASRSIIIMSLPVGAYKRA
eukprot:1185804-Heterocapsa_arctica.AAC.1